MRANQAEHAVATMCRVLGVSPSGYYAWRGRGRSHRAKRDEVLRGTIGTIHQQSRGTYGVPRVHADLVAGGCRVSRKRVARLMRDVGLAGVSRRRGTRDLPRDHRHITYLTNMRASRVPNTLHSPSASDAAKWEW